MHRRFELHRDEDPTGVSGTGKVAEGTLFSSGTAVIEWLSDWPSTNIYRADELWGLTGLNSIDRIHGHDGKTRIVWIDEEEDDQPPSD